MKTEANSYAFSRGMLSNFDASERLLVKGMQMRESHTGNLISVEYI